MAKTRKRSLETKKRASSRNIGPQAPADVWTPQELLDALRKPSLAEKVKMLRDVGILDSRGKLAKKYRSPGNRVSRTQTD
jgi:hypothetical protein